MEHPSGLDRNPVRILALKVCVLSHHILSRASFHLKTRKEYFFHDEESFDLLDLVELGDPPLLAPVLLIFFKGNGPKWGTWPTTAPFCPIFVAMIFFAIM